MAYSLDTNQTISAAARGESGINGGTAFNIGGINLGTQYPSAATAGGSVPSGLSSALGGISDRDLLIAAGLVALVLGALLWRRK